MQNTRPNKPASGKGKAILGAAVMAVLVPALVLFEGNVLRGYVDPVGIPTKCVGDTNNVEVGRVYSEEECLHSLDEQIAKHGAGVLACSPSLRENTYFAASAVSFAYNLGVGTYCNSSIAAAFNRGDPETACKRFNENAAGKPQWIYVKDEYDPVTKKWTYKSLPGLISRRAEERALCERGLL